MRLQLSMLLLPMTTRANFCAMKFISFVDLEQLNSPKDVPLRFSKPACRALERLVPARGAERAAFAYHRLSQSFVVFSHGSTFRVGILSRRIGRAF